MPPLTLVVQNKNLFRLGSRYFNDATAETTTILSIEEEDAVVLVLEDGWRVGLGSGMKRYYGPSQVEDLDGEEETATTKENGDGSNP